MWCLFLVLAMRSPFATVPHASPCHICRAVMARKKGLLAGHLTDDQERGPCLACKVEEGGSSVLLSTEKFARLFGVQHLFPDQPRHGHCHDATVYVFPHLHNRALPSPASGLRSSERNEPFTVPRQSIPLCIAG